MTCCGDSQEIMFYGRVTPDVRDRVTAFLASNPLPPIACDSQGKVIAVRASHNRFSLETWEQELTRRQGMLADCTVPGVTIKPTEQRPLSFVQKVKSFVRAKTGGKTTPAVAETRKGLCNTCEYLDKLNRRCHLCGCLVDDKVRWAKSYCPHDPPKWPSVQSAEPDTLPEPQAQLAISSNNRIMYTAELLTSEGRVKQ